MVSVATKAVLICLAVYTGIVGIRILFRCLRSRRFGPNNGLLCYTKIGTAPKRSSLKYEWMTAKNWERYILKLQKRGYSFLTLKDFLLHPQTASVCLVFMGGYRSFYTEIFPLIQKYQLPATLLLAPDLIGSYNAWQNPHQEPWQDIITKEELEVLKTSPLLSFGALPLSGKNILRCSHEQAVYAIQESIYRLHTQFGISAQAWGNYSSNHVPDNQLTKLQEQGIDLPYLAVRTNR